MATDESGTYEVEGRAENDASDGSSAGSPEVLAEVDPRPSAVSPYGESDAGAPVEAAPKRPAATGNGAAAQRTRLRKGSAKRKSRVKVTRSSRGTKSAPARVQRSFPASSFEEALELANTMHRMGSDRVRRLTLFEELGRSAESGPSRQLIINSGRYGLTTGGVQAEWIELTDEGKLATNPEAPRRQQTRARFTLAIENVSPFKAIYDQFAGKRVPSQSVMRDFLREQKYQEAEIQECIDTFTVNAKFVGVLRVIAGAERLLAIDHALDELPSGSAPEVEPAVALSLRERTDSTVAAADAPDWSRIGFYVTGIGDEDGEIRKHSDLFLGSIVEPALAEFDLTVVRADQIGKPGMITAQVIEHVVNSRVVIADLSYHNPNVFYEIALRHAVRKPIVQLIRGLDPIPFDLDQFRTIKIDTTDIYSLLPQIETYRSEIANQVRRALEGTAVVDNPLTVFFPGFWDLMAGGHEQQP